MTSFEQFLKDYRLTTAEILYHMPDHPSLLQTYVWQELDISPEFPVLKKFLHFWERSLDGKLHSVQVASCEIIKPAEFQYARAKFYLQ
ncbi:MAG: Usg family protein [Proteobacteria bacterium]|nr:Usg family protein [Pseudomonadota bacterium]